MRSLMIPSAQAAAIEQAQAETLRDRQRRADLLARLPPGAEAIVEGYSTDALLQMEASLRHLNRMTGEEFAAAVAVLDADG